MAIQVVFVPNFMAIKGRFFTHQPAGVIIDAVLLPAFVLNAGQQKAMIVVAILQLTTIGVYSTSQQVKVIAGLESGFPTLLINKPCDISVPVLFVLPVPVSGHQFVGNTAQRIISILRNCPPATLPRKQPPRASRRLLR